MYLRGGPQSFPTGAEVVVGLPTILPRSCLVGKIAEGSLFSFSAMWIESAKGGPRPFYF